MSSSDLCHKCILEAVIVTSDGQVMFLDHASSCARGRGDREFFGASQKPIYLVDNGSTRVDVVDDVPATVERWTRLGVG